MRFLAISDLRGALERLPQVVKLARDEGVDVVVFAGNILSEDGRGEAFHRVHSTGEVPAFEPALLSALEDQAVQAYEAFFDAMGQLDVPVILVPGYLDAPERLFLQASLNHEVVAPNIHMVHRSFLPLPHANLVVTGFGGGLSGEVRENRYLLVYPEWEAEFAFEFLRHLEQEPVFVFHTPPSGEDLDLDGDRHIGSAIVRELIKAYRPRFAFCGSAVDGQGSVKIGTTLVVNPGALRDGHYALLDTHAEAVTFGQLGAPERAAA